MITFIAVLVGNADRWTGISSPYRLSRSPKVKRERNISPSRALSKSVICFLLLSWSKGLSVESLLPYKFFITCTEIEILRSHLQLVSLKNGRGNTPPPPSPIPFRPSSSSWFKSNYNRMIIHISIALQKRQKNCTCPMVAELYRASTSHEEGQGCQFRSQ